MYPHRVVAWRLEPQRFTFRRAIVPARETSAKAGNHEKRNPWSSSANLLPLLPEAFSSSQSLLTLRCKETLAFNPGSIIPQGRSKSAGLLRQRWFSFASLFLNSSKVDFGKLLGIYGVLFSLVAQVVAKLQFHQTSSKPPYLGGAFVVVGGPIMTLWKA
jgi:hypothetical protein